MALDVLGMEDPPQEEEVDPDVLDSMLKVEAALQTPIKLPPKSWFVKGKAVHVQFDGGS